MNNMDKLQELQEIHDKLKEHKFREIFNNKYALIGTWKNLLSNYLDLLLKSLDIIYDLARNKIANIDIIKDLWWIHNFRAWLGRIRYYYLIKDEESLDNDPLAWTISPNFPNGMIYQDFYDIDNRYDLTNFIIFTDRYIGELHLILDNHSFDYTVDVVYERATIPHCGMYYYHFCDLRKDNEGNWGYIKAPEWYGTWDNKNKKYIKGK